VNLSVSIMAHPKRRRYIPYLKEHLGDVPVGWDYDGDIWHTRREALKLHDPEARFHLMVQDDAIIGREFYPRLAQILERVGDQHAYSLFYRFKSKHTHADFNAAGAQGLKAGGFSFQRLQFGIAVVLPTRVIPGLLERADTYEDLGRNEDLRMSRYLVDELGMSVYYPLPSLVDHRRELHGLNGPNWSRVARWFE